jgi:excisionase family DNA binding protein
LLSLGTGNGGSGSGEEVTGMKKGKAKRHRELTWLTIREACDYLRVSRQTIYRLVCSGRLVPDGKVGSRWRFSKSGLDAYVKSGRVPDCDRMERPAGEVCDAEKEDPAETDARSGDMAGRPGPVSGACAVDGPQDGPEEEKRGNGGDVCGGGESQGEARGPRRSGKASFAEAVRRLRRAVA